MPDTTLKNGGNPKSHKSRKTKQNKNKNMKKSIKITIFSIIVLTALTVSAQEKFATYENTYSNKAYQILITRSEKYSLYVDAMSVDKVHEEGGIMIMQKHHPEFINSLVQAKNKYQEWRATAQENNVKELDKTMALKSSVSAYFLYGSKWNFQFNTSLKYDFKIIERNDSVEYLLIVRTGELQSATNQFMKVDGFVLVFTSAKEIEDFIGAISSDKIAEFMNKPKPNDLFKD
jgi:flagellar basal body-associated protein FliL